MTACQRSSTSIEGRITRVIPPSEIGSTTRVFQHDLPQLKFSLLIKNKSDAPATINVNDYGRTLEPENGKFWVKYGQGDSLELFGTSCEFCLRSVTINPADSLPLTLQVAYLHLGTMADSTNSVEWILGKMKEVENTWESIKYVEHNGHELFNIPRDKQLK